MYSDSENQSQLRLGATFIPGGVDDFLVPEVFSPLPQRSMPEVPQQIQDNLAHLELEAESSSRAPGSQPRGEMYRDQISNASRLPNHHDLSQMQQPGAGQDPTRYSAQTPNGQGLNDDISDQPSFSPFPQVVNRPPNVPPSDEEKETMLEKARVAVLNSNNAEVQLIWAQDTLCYVEIAMANETRLAEIQRPRPGTPRVEHQLRVDAVNIVSFLADQHHPKAEFMRGTWLEFGKFGFRMDKKEAYRCYSWAARGGYSRAEYRMGMQFESSNDIPRAIKHYSLGVDGRDSASNYRLGMMTLLGQCGQRQDYYRGVELIRFAADTADENAPQGAYIYGMLQARELPQITVPEQILPLNIDSALYYIEKAAYLGFGKAQTKMGSAYELCQLGCQFDPILSLHYNSLAARQGDPEAEMAISKWFLSGYEGIFKKSEEMAFTYAYRAAQTGLATAEFAMGYFYEVGIHVQVSLKEARIWYGKAAEHGNKDASARIEGITRSKTLSRKDHENIAVAKIKSSRASRYGSKPERSARPAMPAMPEIPPMPENASGLGSVPVAGPSYQEYARYGPYSPTAEKHPYTGAPYGNPITVTHTDFSPIPMPRPTSAATTGGMPSESHHGLMSPDGATRQRPQSAMADPIYGGGRGSVPTPGPGPPNVQGYGRTSAGPPGKPPPVPSKDKPVYAAPQVPLPTIEIGFVAPPDLSGADRKKRSQRSDNPIAGYPPAGTGYNPRPERISSRPKMPPPTQTQSTGGRSQSPYPSTEPPASADRPPRHDSMPSRLGNGSSAPAAPMPEIPSASLVSPPQSTATNPGGRRPGKGPSTFEEMGVPQQKKEDDCIIM